MPRRTNCCKQAISPTTIPPALRPELLVKWRFFANYGFAFLGDGGTRGTPLRTVSKRGVVNLDSDSCFPFTPVLVGDIALVKLVRESVRRDSILLSARNERYRSTSTITIFEHSTTGRRARVSGRSHRSRLHGQSFQSRIRRRQALGTRALRLHPRLRPSLLESAGT